MSASNVCPACGAVNGLANLFCINCGTRLGAPASAAGPAPTPYPTPPYAPMPPGGPMPAGAYPYMPGPPPIRRATFSNILSATFEVWTKNFLNFFIVFLSLAVLNGVIGGLLAFAFFGTFGLGTGVFPGSPPAGVTAGSLGTLLLFGLVVFVLSAIITSTVIGGMTEYAVRRNRGESMTLERALRRGFERFLSILGANILLTFMVVGLVVLPLLAIIYPLASSGGAIPAGTAIAVLCGGLLAFVVGCVVALYVYLGMVLFAPAIMLENQNAVGSLKRSWRITKGSRWSILGAIIALALIQALIGAAISVPTMFITNPILSLITSALVSGLVGSWFVIMPAVAYDLIMRQPTYTAPPYYPGPAMGPPAGFAPPGPPPGAPPPSGP